MNVCAYIGCEQGHFFALVKLQDAPCRFTLHWCSLSQYRRCCCALRCFNQPAVWLVSHREHGYNSNKTTNPLSVVQLVSGSCLRTVAWTENFAGCSRSAICFSELALPVTGPTSQPTTTSQAEYASSGHHVVLGIRFYECDRRRENCCHRRWHERAPPPRSDCSRVR